MGKDNSPITDEINGKNGCWKESSMDLCQDSSYTSEEAVNSLQCGTFQVKLVFLTGFVWMADAFESVLSSIINSMLTCEWQLSRWQGAFISTMSSLGTAVGGLVFGIISDKYGRRTSLSTSLIFLFVFGAVSAGAPSFAWILTFRALVGFALGAMPQALTLCCEFAPARKKGRAVFFLSYFWSFGIACFVLIAWGIMGASRSWRALVGIAAIPAFIAMVLIKFFPESLSYLCSSGQGLEAVLVLREMTNDTVVPGRLLPDVLATNRGQVAALWNPKFKRSSSILCYCWLWIGIAYTGLLVLSPPILDGEEISNIKIADWRDFLGNIHAPLRCLDATDSFFTRLLWTRTADLPGMLSLLFFADRVSKSWLSCVCCSVAGILICLLLLPLREIEVRLFLLFFSRAMILTQYQVLMFITSEVYPTSIRGVALGLGTTFYAIGSFLASYIVQGLANLSISCCIGVLGAGVLLAGISSAFLATGVTTHSFEESPETCRTKL